MKRFSHSLAALFALLALAWVPSAAAATAEKIDAEADRAMALLRSNVTGAESLLRDAHGVLIMPAVIKAGIGVGGEYGEGVLRIDGKPVDYYSIASASIGLQLGAQKKDIILLFMQEAALKRFRGSAGWKAGVDGSVALVEVGAGGAIDTVKLNQPILGFVVGQKGLMANLTLEGSKFTKLVR
jgi:lipid-binding SYLF domain-containing protein